MDEEIRELRRELLENILPKLPACRRNVVCYVKKGHPRGFRHMHLPPGKWMDPPKLAHGGVILTMNPTQHKRLRFRASCCGHATVESYLKTPTTMTWLTVPGHGEPTVKEDLKGRITITTSPQDSVKIQRLAKAAGHSNVCQWFISSFTANA